MYKAHHVWITFGSSDIEKVHVLVAQSTVRSQNLQSTPASEHVLALTCRRSSLLCWAKYMLKSNVQKAEKCGAPLDTQMSFCPAGAGFARPVTSEQDVNASPQFQLQPTLRYTSPHYNYNYECIKLHCTDYGTLRGTTLQDTKCNYRLNWKLDYNDMTLHYTTFYFTILSYTTLH